MADAVYGIVDEVEVPQMGKLVSWPMFGLVGLLVIISSIISLVMIHLQNRITGRIHFVFATELKVYQLVFMQVYDCPFSCYELSIHFSYHLVTH